MEEFTIDLEKLKIKPGASATAEHLNKIIDAMIETRKYVSDLMEEHNEEHRQEILEKMLEDAAA